MNDPVIKPVSGQPILSLGAFDIASLGYEMAEYFVAGQASSYSPVGELKSDGFWTVEPDGLAPFATRIVVLTPVDAAHFNGTVIVEWLNVTGGIEMPVDWYVAHREIVREGYAYVAVSAQRVGIEGGLSRGADMSLKKTHPERYASLDHPGDAFCYDIFTQVGRLVRDKSAAVLGHLRPERVIAVGESQSAWFLTTYVNAIDRHAQVYDGFLIHSRFAPVGPLDGTSIFSGAPDSMPAAPRIRTDVRVPVMTVVTETDVVGGLRPGFHSARQADSGKLRIWEIAGTAHADLYMLEVAAIDTGLLPISDLAAAYVPTKRPLGMTLTRFINFAPQHHYVLQAALLGLDRWVRTGEAPPEAPRLSLDDAEPAALVLDADGIATGGIRTPWVDVPVAVTSGAGDPEHAVASMFGSGEPFDEATLSRLYPRGRADYLARFEAALDRTINAGFLLPTDRSEILALAAACYPTD